MHRNAPEDHVDLVTKLQNTVKISQKTLQTLMKEAASVQAHKIIAEKPKYAVVQRKDGDADFVSVLLSDLADQVYIFFLFTSPSLN